jgi:hypothetical protein
MFIDSSDVAVDLEFYLEPLPNLASSAYFAEQP